MKHCKKCSTNKNEDDFGADKHRRDGKNLYCRICVYSYARERHKIPEVRNKKIEYNKNRLSDPIHYKASLVRSRKFYESINGRARTLLNNATKSPAGKSREFSLTLEYLIENLKRGTCAVTGIQFQMDNTHQLLTNRKKNPYAPSVDRINPALGYTNENTQVVIWWYNMAKAELSDSEMQYLCRIVMGKKDES